MKLIVKFQLNSIYLLCGEQIELSLESFILCYVLNPQHYHWYYADLLPSQEVTSGLDYSCRQEEWTESLPTSVSTMQWLGLSPWFPSQITEVPGMHPRVPGCSEKWSTWPGTTKKEHPGAEPGLLGGGRSVLRSVLRSRRKAWPDWLFHSPATTPPTTPTHFNTNNTTNNLPLHYHVVCVSGWRLMRYDV